MPIITTPDAVLGVAIWRACRSGGTRGANFSGIRGNLIQFDLAGSTAASDRRLERLLGQLVDAGQLELARDPAILAKRAAGADARRWRAVWNPEQ